MYFQELEPDRCDDCLENLFLRAACFQRESWGKNAGRKCTLIVEVLLPDLSDVKFGIMSHASFVLPGVCQPVFGRRAVIRRLVR